MSDDDGAHEVLRFAWTPELGADTMFAYLSPMIREMHSPPIECREFVLDELAELVPVLQRTISQLADVLEIVANDRLADPQKKQMIIAGLNLIRQGDRKVQAGSTLYGEEPPLSRFLSAKIAVGFPTGPLAGFAPSASTDNQPGGSTDDPAPRRQREIPGTSHPKPRRMQ